MSGSLRIVFVMGTLAVAYVGCGATPDRAASPNQPASSDRSVLPDRPPAQYHLTDVTITLGHSSYGYTNYEDATVINGDGAAVLTRDDSGETFERAFRVDEVVFRRLLRDLYEIRFFDMNDSYSSREGINISADGKVQNVATIRTHDWHSSVTVSIGDFSKTVTSTSFGIPPSDFQAFVDRLEGLIAEYVPESRRQ